MRFGRRGLPILVAVVIALVAVPALAAVALTRVSNDPYSNTASQHRTEVEPDTFSFGSTIVSAFQVGRVFGGGAANIGWARSADGGATWTNGFLPGTTGVATPTGPYSAISDPAVAYDRRHNVWLISSLGIRSNGTNQVVTSRSTNGGANWSNPVVTSTTGNPDKNWIVCDNTTTSPFYGNCYTVHGELDGCQPRERAVAVAELTGGTLVALEGAGHLAQARHPVMVNGLLREFAATVVPPTLG